MTETPVAVLGLGRLGAAVAHRLTARGHHVTTWTRSGRSLPSVPAAPTAAEAASGAIVVVLSLFDARACHAVLDVIGLKPGQTVVNLSTVSPQDAADLDARVRATGATYLRAPVIGSVPAATAGTLKILASAEHPLFADLGEVLLCPDPQAAASAKLLANGVLGASLLAIRQALHDADALALPDHLTSAILERTALGGLWQAKRDARKGGTPAAFTVAALAKDLDLLAQHSPSARPLSDALAGGSSEARSGTGLELLPDDDVAALWRGAPATAVLPPPQNQNPARPNASHHLTLSPQINSTADVLEPLRAYVAGHATGDPEHHRQAFLPSAHIEGLRDGRFLSWTLEEYCSLFTGQPAPDEPRRRRRVERISVSGTVAGATMTLWHGTDVFTDEFVLIRLEDRWQIANKVYHRAVS